MTASHRLYLPDLEQTDTNVRLTGDEARHAVRAKRLRCGEPVELLNGRGLVLSGTVHALERSPDGITVAITGARTEPSTAPEVTVFAAAPKGRRIDALVDQLAQVGAAGWGPLTSARTVVDPRPTKLERLERLAAETSKQSGRAWLLRLETPMALEQALEGSADTVLADASGDPYAPSGSAQIRLLIGPEGGFTPDEVADARAAGARIACFGPHVMRVETAAPVAAGIILHRERESAV